MCNASHVKFFVNAMYDCGRVVFRAGSWSPWALRLESDCGPLVKICNIDFILVLLPSFFRYVVNRNRNFFSLEISGPKVTENVSCSRRFGSGPYRSPGHEASASPASWVIRHW